MGLTPRAIHGDSGMWNHRDSEFSIGVGTRGKAAAAVVGAAAGLSTSCLAFRFWRFSLCFRRASIASEFFLSFVRSEVFFLERCFKLPTAFFILAATTTDSVTLTSSSFRSRSYLCVCGVRVCGVRGACVRCVCVVRVINES